MPRVTFISHFDWYPPELKGRWMQAYKTGWSGLVTTACAAEARRLGKIVESRQGASETGGNTTGRAQRRKAGPRAER